MKEQNAYAILVDENSLKISRDYSNMEIRIVKIGERAEIRNPGSDDAFDGLVFSCQWDQRKPLDITYGWQVQYRDCYIVDLNDAKRMFKTLQRIEKITGSFAVRPVTFGQYVSLHAAALGIKQGRRESPRSTHSTSYSENTYITLDLHSVQYAIDDLIAKCRESQAATV
jgi:hypothetical protein